MFYYLFHLPFFQQMDSRIYDLERQLEFYRMLLLVMTLIIAILAIAALIQRASIYRIKNSGTAAGRGKTGRGSRDKAGRPAVNGVSSSELPDPGLIFKYTLSGDESGRKVITIGRDEGSIRTWSTEVINDHIELHIRSVIDLKDKMLRDLPDRLYCEYEVEFRRNGNVLIHYPGLDGYRKMDPSEKILIKREPDTSGTPAFAMIEPARPVRLRLGMELEEFGRFSGGYFEFHLYLQDYETETESGMPRIEKNFMVRLYRIYPGYDISSPDGNGLYPMIDPFNAGK